MSAICEVQQTVASCDKLEGKDNFTTERKVATFDEGDAEEFIKWRIGFETLAAEHPLDTAHKKLRMIRTLLRGNAKDKFETYCGYQ